MDGTNEPTREEIAAAADPGTGAELAGELEGLADDAPSIAPASMPSWRASGASARRGDSPETRLRLMAENLELVFRQVEGYSRETRQLGEYFQELSEEMRATMALMQRQVGDHDATLERMRIAVSAQLEVERRLRELLVYVGRERRA